MDLTKEIKIDMTNKRNKRKEGKPQKNVGHAFNKRDKRRDDNNPYTNSSVNKRKKIKEGNPQQNFGHFHQLVKRSYNKKDHLGNCIKKSYFIQWDSLSRQRSE